jgi:hypothetical protein
MVQPAQYSLALEFKHVFKVPTGHIRRRRAFLSVAMEAAQPTQIFLMNPSAVIILFGMVRCAFCATHQVTGTVRPAAASSRLCV